MGKVCRPASRWWAPTAMMSASWRRCWTAKSFISPTPPKPWRRTCAPMRAMSARRLAPSSAGMVTSRMCGHAVKRSRPGRTGATSRAAGLSKCHTAGSTTSASSSCVMKRQPQTASPCTTSQLPQSHYAAAKAKTAEMLFTDRF